jgi:hypothetical protein
MHHAARQKQFCKAAAVLCMCNMAHYITHLHNWANSLKEGLKAAIVRADRPFPVLDLVPYSYMLCRR